jgi:hypothetical protein
MRFRKMRIMVLAAAVIVVVVVVTVRNVVDDFVLMKTITAI